MNEDTPTLDFAIVAEKAEAVNGRLYMMGGALERIDASPRAPMALSLAIGVLVPWFATNIDHVLTMRLEDSDGHQVVGFQTNFKVGRPAELEDGATQRILAVMNMSALFGTPGRYIITVTVANDEKRVSFFVRLTPPPAAAPEAEPA